MKKIISVLYLMIFLSILIFSCKKDEDRCPCSDAVPISADFFIEERVSNNVGLDWYEADTLGAATSKRYRAANINPDQNISYYWEIDHDGNSSTESIYSLSNFPPGDWYEVTLWVEGTPRLDCFPNDDGRDSLTKAFYIPDASYESHMAGKYRYEYNGITDTLLLKIHTTYPGGIPAPNERVMHNFPPGCMVDTSIINTGYAGATTGAFHSLIYQSSSYSPNVCYGLTGYVLYDNNTLTGEFKQLDTTDYDPLNPTFEYTPIFPFSATKVD